MGKPSTLRRLARRACERDTATSEQIALNRATLVAERAKYERVPPTTPEHIARLAEIERMLANPGVAA